MCRFWYLFPCDSHNSHNDGNMVTTTCVCSTTYNSRNNCNKAITLMSCFRCQTSKFDIITTKLWTNFLPVPILYFCPVNDRSESPFTCAPAAKPAKIVRFCLSVCMSVFLSTSRWLAFGSPGTVVSSSPLPPWDVKGSERTSSWENSRCFQATEIFPESV